VKPTTDILRADFDRLALLEQDGWNHNNHYHSFLLRHVPPHCQTALDVGCGTGAFTRQLALLAQQVTGFDLSPADQFAGDAAQFDDARSEKRPYSKYPRTTGCLGNARSTRLLSINGRFAVYQS
jgi:SAM-dependent methyltransferase